MENIQALKRRVKDRIKALQEFLEMLDLVEHKAAELAIAENIVEGSVSLLATGHISETGQTFADYTAAEAAKRVVLESNKAWTAGQVFEEVKQRGKTGVTREAVAVALRRLAKAGVLDARKSRNRKLGRIYRGKVPEEPVSQT